MLTTAKQQVLPFIVAPSNFRVPVLDSLGFDPGLADQEEVGGLNEVEVEFGPFRAGEEDGQCQREKTAEHRAPWPSRMDGDDVQTKVEET